jgi:hypothetical protein
MHEIDIHIEPAEKYRRVIGGVAIPDQQGEDEVSLTDDAYEDWPEEHKEAANGYIDAVDEGSAHTATISQIGDTEYRISCPTCSRSWTTTAQGHRVEGAKDDLRSRLKAHRPCEDGETLSWDVFSVAADPDLVAKIATYFDGMTPDEPTDLLRAKLRLLDCSVYANAQLAATAELREVA